MMMNTLKVTGGGAKNSYGFIGSWHVIDGVINRNAAFADDIKSQAVAIACDESIQAASDWSLEFEKIYKKISKYPSLRYDINRQLKSRSKDSGLRAAINWFKSFELKFLRLNTSFLTVESHDKDVVEEARAMAMKCERMMLDELQSIKDSGYDGLYVMKSAERLAIAVCEGAGVRYPSIGLVDDEKAAIAAVCARLFCEKWWRKKLRRLQAVKLEDAARYMGMVCKRRGGYCSEATLRRRYFQKSRNQQLLEKLEAQNEEGQVYTLAELSELGVSNPAIRRAELMTRIRGFEEVAEEIGGWSPVFITQTCPSRFHSHHASGSQFPNWKGATPRDGQKYLTKTWSKVRAALARAEIKVFGFRVCEPHHDGCPHWHALFWVPSHQLDLMIKIYESYSLADTPPPKGKESVRFKAMVDELASGATNYIAKYISKNVDGLKEDGEAWSSDVVKTAMRTEAWASTHGIRQFQQIGGASVTVYREMRRLRDEYAESEEVEEIRKAADNGDWKQYTLAMGGAVIPNKKRPLRAYMVKRVDDAGNKVKNAYGEFVRKIRGLMAFNFLPVVTRFHEWVISPVNNSSPSKKGSSFQVGVSPPLDLCQ